MSKKKLFNVVTEYTGHPKLGDWESTSRAKSFAEAKEHMNRKLDHLMTADLTRVGEFKSIRMEPVT